MAIYLEQRVEQLEEENEALKARLEKLERTGYARFVTVKELAEIMECSPQNIHRRIKTGEIRATRLLGDARVPLDQFMNDARESVPDPVIKPGRDTGRTKSMRELVFGTGA